MIKLGPLWPSSIQVSNPAAFFFFFFSFPSHPKVLFLDHYLSCLAEGLQLISPNKLLFSGCVMNSGWKCSISHNLPTDTMHFFQYCFELGNWNSFFYPWQHSHDEVSEPLRDWIQYCALQSARAVVCVCVWQQAATWWIDYIWSMLGFAPSYTQVVGKDRNYDKWTAEFQCCTVSAQMTQGWLAWVQ